MSNLSERLERLTRVEEMLAYGLKDYEIANRLKISLKIVRGDISSIIKKSEKELKKRSSEILVKKYIEIKMRRRRLCDLLERKDLSVKEQLRIIKALRDEDKNWMELLKQMKIIGKDAPKPKETLHIEFVSPAWAEPDGKEKLIEYDVEVPSKKPY